MTEKKYPKYVPVEVHVKPIQGGFGTTVNPGDKVAMVRSGFGNSVGCDQGTYIGYIVSKPSGNLRARVAMEQTYSRWCHADGREFDWKKEYNHRTWNEVKDTLHTESKTRTVNVTLHLNRIVAIK